MYMHTIETHVFCLFLLGRMLQLILGCAVNCDHKQQYIESIMNLEESVQQVLMLAIQEMITSGSTKGNIIFSAFTANISGSINEYRITLFAHYMSLSLTFGLDAKVFQQVT